MDYKKRIAELAPEIIEIRRDLHRHPELSTKEFRTSAKVDELLTAWGIEHERVADTGIVAVVHGAKPGRTVAARADMDALPLEEDPSHECCSETPGVMHACGHDVHTAVLLGAARVMKEMEQELCGTVRFFFQPAEEAVGGAERMVKAGCCEGVDYVIGLHVQPEFEVGTIEMRHGQLNAATDTLTLTVRGKSGHGAHPDEAVDAIVAAANVVTALQSFVSRNLSAVDSAVLTIGTIVGGTKNNIIADEVVMSGTLRTLNKETRALAYRRIQEITTQVAAAYGCTAEVVIDPGYISLCSTNEVVDVLQARARAILGEEHVLEKEYPSLGGEDFGYFVEAAQRGGAFYHLGCGNTEKGMKAGLHNHDFQPDERCIPIGMELHTAFLLDLLAK